MWVKLLLYLSLECTGRISCYLLIMVMLWLQVRGGYGRYILYSTRRYYVLSLAKLVATKTTDIIKFYDRCHQRVVTRVSALTFWSLGVAGSSEVSMVCTKILEIPEQLQIPDHQLLFCLAPPPRIFFGLSSSFRETMHLNSIYWHELVYEYGEESVLNLCGFTLFLIYVLPSRPRPAISHVS